MIGRQSGSGDHQIGDKMGEWGVCRQEGWGKEYWRAVMLFREAVEPGM
jgi:hypothetical protein